MEQPVQALKGRLDQLSDLLDRGSLVSLSQEETLSLADRAGKLSEKLTSIESSFLTMGLLGGTGVGKSSLMNALAGVEIASTSYRRPHTDTVLIYRHAAASPLPALNLANVSWREITHQADAVRQILLCDLPDFDSLVGEHREHVLRFLEHLDVLVWVTSPEKYADGRLYDLVREVPKAKQNFYFVLNKADLLFQGEALESGYEQMEQVMRSFRRHLAENGIGTPLVYALSAQEVLRTDEPAPWNQYPAFTQQVFQQRDVKEITAIKAGNLDVEVQQLLAVLRREEQSLERFQALLEAAVKDVEEQRPSWVQGGQAAIDLWLEQRFREELVACRSDPSLLVGPGQMLAGLVREWRQRSRQHPENSSAPLPVTPPDEVALSFRRRLEWLQERLDHRILLQNLPAPLHQRLRANLEVAGMFEELKEDFSRLVAVHLARPSLSGFLLFKASQWFTYLLLLVFFLLAVGGEAAWRAVLDNPGWRSVGALLLTAVHTLFSPKGLAALASYALLNVFFAVRFYRRFRSLVRRGADRSMASLRVELGKAWEEKLDTVVAQLNRFSGEIRSQRLDIATFRKDASGKTSNAE
jgi:GTP-binding protein EngB required for normal cell division